MSWLAMKMLGLPRWGWLLALALAIGGAVVWLRADENADDQRNQNLGAAAQRASDAAETIKRTEEGNAAREEIHASGPAGDRARYDQCVRSARNPANCQRFLPE